MIVHEHPWKVMLLMMNADIHAIYFCAGHAPRCRSDKYLEHHEKELLPVEDSTRIHVDAGKVRLDLYLQLLPFPADWPGRLQVSQSRQLEHSAADASTQ